LRLAIENGIQTIAFPNISTGVYGYPKKEAAEIAVQTVKKFLEPDTRLTKIYFVCFDEENYKLYQSLIA
jgi:O-acetyl-ADP-ribose deacetylase (regulator of RNase III)